MVNLAERFAKIICPTCKGTMKVVVDISVRVPLVGGDQIQTRKATEKCLQCDNGYIINEDYLKVAEEALAARRSLAQEIGECLKVRGFWCPDDLDSSDIILGVAKALDNQKDDLDNANAVLNQLEEILPGGIAEALA